MRVALPAVLTLLSAAAPSLAQMPGADIVKTRAAVRPASVKPGGAGILVIAVAVSSGYHINAPKPNDPDLIPTTFRGSGPAGITFGLPRFPAPRAISVSYEKQPMLVYVGRTVILIPFTVAKSDKPGRVALDGTLNFQGCSATSCFPPASAPVGATVIVK